MRGGSWVATALVVAMAIWLIELGFRGLEHELRSSEQAASWIKVHEDDLAWNPVLMGNGCGSVALPPSR